MVETASERVHGAPAPTTADTFKDLPMTITLRRSFAAVTAILAGLTLSTGATASSATPAEDAAAAAGYVRVIDQTGAFSLDIPAGWVAATAPDHYPGIDGQFTFETLLPTIVASPTGEQYVDGTVVLPSVFVQAYPNPEAVENGEFYGDYGVDCTTFESGDFSANGLTGTWGTTSGCQWAPGEVRASLWARFDDGSGSVFVDYFSTTGADTTWTAMINSIRLAGTPIQTVAGPAPFVPVFPYATFGDVPQLGTEPVRGTGCGADGSIGDVIPDGIWAGFVDVPAPNDPLSVDLVCIFTPEAAIGVLADGSATVLVPAGRAAPDPDYLVVNNNERERTVAAAPGLELRDAVMNVEHCVEGSFLPDVDHSGYQAWINIENGKATWVVWGCDWFGGSDDLDGPTPVGPAPAPTGPPATAGPTTAAPAPPDNPEDALLQADCALVQNTIWEGDAFLGVEYPADGEPFTDSLRQAIEATRDFFSYEASQAQSQVARDAFAQYYAEWDSLLQAGIYTSTNIGAVTEAGLFALAPLQNACGWAG